MRKCYFEAFYNGLEKSERKKVLQLIRHFADRKQLMNKEKFRNLRGKIFELKPHPVRLLGFYHGEGVFVITHGFKKGEPVEKEIEKAEVRRRRFLETGG